MQVSVHSFLRMVKLAEPLMTSDGSLLAMSYYGAAFLVNDEAKAITGNIAYVDARYHVAG